MGIHGSWTRSARKPSAAELEFKQDHQTGVKGDGIVFDAKNIMIDLG